MTVVLALVIGIVIGVLLTVLFKDNWVEQPDPREDAVRSRTEINAIRHETIRQMKAASRQADVERAPGRGIDRP